MSKTLQLLTTIASRAFPIAGTGGNFISDRPPCSCCDQFEPKIATCAACLLLRPGEKDEWRARRLTLCAARVRPVTVARSSGAAAAARPAAHGEEASVVEAAVARS